MTPAQFDALAQARRLPASASREALHAVLVGGLTVADAARAAGCSYPAAYRAAEKHRAWVALLKAAGFERAPGKPSRASKRGAR